MCIVTTGIQIDKILAISRCVFKKLCLPAVRTAAVGMKRENVMKQAQQQVVEFPQPKHDIR
jgi:hypothetical protein